ncbi:MAG: DUF4115 domain-containing protein [Acidobacteriota bacterium]|jgi:cytoskeleton protein RodZ|nr:DUF4115 domain-containing protein [Acidobacteriota bacterium]
MGVIAAELKARRESLNLSLEQVSKDTLISLRHLESLENGRYKELPGGMYDRAFLRTYCDLLQLDSKEILRRYEDEVEPIPEIPVLQPQKRLPSTTRIPPVAVWSLLFLISAGGIFLGRDRIAAVFSPYFTDRPGHLVDTDDADNLLSGLESEQSLASVDTKDLGNTVTADTSTDTVSTSETLSTAGLAPGVETGQIPTVTTITPAVASVPPVQAATPPLRSLRLEIVGSESCWFSVSADGAHTVSDMLQPGDTKSFTADRQLAIHIGNAGGVLLKVNGRALRPLGKTGKAVRLTIDADSLSNLIDPAAS